MVNRRRLLFAAAPVLVSGPAAALCLHASAPADPALPLARSWLAAKAEIDRAAPLKDAEVDRLCDVAEAAEDALFMTPAISPAGALACLQMIEVSVRREENGCVPAFSAAQVGALMAGARALLQKIPSMPAEGLAAVVR